MLQNRAHAHFNNVYVIAPNVGPVYLHPQMQHPFDIAGGQSHIVDYMGNVLVVLAVRRQHVRHGDRRHRGAPAVPRDEPQLELDEGPAHRGVPAHVRGADPSEEPVDVAGADLARVRRRALPAATSSRLIERGAYTPPADEFEGAKFFPMDARRSPDEAWSEARHLWDEPDD